MKGLAIVLAVTILASCEMPTNDADRGRSDGATTSTTPAQGVLATYTEQVEIADLFQFAAPALDGKQVDGRAYEDKILAVWFWTPWCSICNTEAPEVVRAARQHPEVEFLGVAGRDSRDAMQSFVDEYGIEFPTLPDEDGSLWRHFGVSGQPTWVFVAASGQTHRVIGAPNESEVEAILDALPLT
jgi:peroxiredoxin